jgi:hypothetical protein
MDTLKIGIDVENGTISVYNNGRGIPIEIHSKEKMYIPELIFGHLLSSSNYDDDEKKLTGGRNGYGAKLANIYSTEFTIDTADKGTSQKYKQTWTDNMGKCGKAKITKNSRGEEYTRVTFTPDLKRFGMTAIDSDTVSLLKKRVYDMAGTVKDVKVYLNDERLKIKDSNSTSTCTSTLLLRQPRKTRVAPRRPSNPSSMSVSATAGRSALPSQTVHFNTSRSQTRYLPSRVARTSTTLQTRLRRTSSRPFRRKTRRRQSNFPRSRNICGSLSMRLSRTRRLTAKPRRP